VAIVLDVLVSVGWTIRLKGAEASGFTVLTVMVSTSLGMIWASYRYSERDKSMSSLFWR